MSSLGLRTASVHLYVSSRCPVLVFKGVSRSLSISLHTGIFEKKKKKNDGSCDLGEGLALEERCAYVREANTRYESEASSSSE